MSKSILGLLSWLLLHWIPLAKGKVMGIMFGGFGRMGEHDSKKTLKLGYRSGGAHRNSIVELLVLTLIGYYFSAI